MQALKHNLIIYLSMKKKYLKALLGKISPDQFKLTFEGVLKVKTLQTAQYAAKSR